MATCAAAVFTAHNGNLDTASLLSITAGAVAAQGIIERNTDYASLGQYSITGSIVPVSGDLLSIVATNASQSEGQSGSKSFTFTVNRTGVTSGTSTVD